MNVDMDGSELSTENREEATPILRKLVRMKDCQAFLGSADTRTTTEKKTRQDLPDKKMV